MLETPKGLRLHIGLFGRRNSGKSTLMNALIGQSISIVSDQPGTTTDPVEKTMELSPLGPVVFVDTAGFDDVGELGALRVGKSRAVLERVDVGLVVVGAEGLGPFEHEIIDALRAALAPQVQIWKAQSVGDTLPSRNLNHVDKYVLDNGQGGTGQRFDWSLLNGEKLDNVLLAGGLSPDNCVEAAKTGCAGLDFNSGVESQPGIKDASKLASVFKTLRAY